MFQGGQSAVFSLRHMVAFKKNISQICNLGTQIVHMSYVSLKWYVPEFIA